MRTQLASPAESGMTIILRRLCISSAEAHICNIVWWEPTE
jgi:hypothetical protein